MIFMEIKGAFLFPKHPYEFRPEQTETHKHINTKHKYAAFGVFVRYILAEKLLKVAHSQPV